jgi:hypothetical protein
MRTQAQLGLSNSGGEKMTKQRAHNNDGFVGVGMTTATLVNTVIVYDPKDGKIIHTHQFATVGSGTPPTEKRMEEAALKFASPQEGKHKLAVLHHGKEPLKPHTAYRVDVNTSRLVEVKP